MEFNVQHAERVRGLYEEHGIDIDRLGSHIAQNKGDFAFQSDINVTAAAEGFDPETIWGLDYAAERHVQARSHS